jgi:carboxypeptidase PM20D1
MKRVALIVVLAIAGVGSIAAFRAERLGGTLEPVAAAELAAFDAAAAAERLAGALRFPTISYLEEGRADDDAFADLRAYLEATFPLSHAALERELVVGHSTLFTWTGTDAALAPLLLLAHYDVVPVEASTLGDWTYPPFGGVVAEGYV